MRNENGETSENVTAKEARAQRIAVHGEAAVTAAEERFDRLSWRDDGVMTPADRAWLFRARKKGLLGPREPASRTAPPEWGGGTWDAWRKMMKRRRHRKHLEALAGNAAAGDAEAEAILLRERETHRFNRLFDKFYAFIREWDRAPPERRKMMLSNTSIVEDLARLRVEIDALGD